MFDENDELLHADLTYRIRGVLYDVANSLWPGLPEKDFQTAVSIGLAKLGIPHELEEEFHVHYRGVEVGRYACDVTVDRRVVLELKAVPTLTDLHRAQMISYLRVTGVDVGLLVNFGAPSVQIERYAGFYARRRPDFSWELQVPEDPKLIHKELVGRLYGCLQRVHYELGPGFFHQVYRRSLQVEFNEQAIPFEFVREIPVFYQGEYVASRPCRLLVVEGKVIVAAFAVKKMDASFVARMRRYLGHFDKNVGVLANLHGDRLAVQLVRAPGVDE